MTQTVEPHAVRLARLLASPPETVLEDLRRSGGGGRRRLSTHLDEELETALAARKEPLIDLALAQYGSSPKVVAPLLAEGLKKGRGEADGQHRRGLRVACYANERLDLFLSDGMLDKLAATPAVAATIALTAPIDEMAILLRNPAVGDATLIGLYAGAGCFEGLEDDRRAWLVELAADNPRIVAGEDDEHGPDWGFWDVHKALFHLVRTAPVTERWCRALHHTLVNIHPPSVAITEPVDEFVERWTLDLKGYDGRALEGHYTGLTFAEEFRCILGAVYGTRFVEGKYVHAGTSTSPTAAARCAYYGGAKLTKKEVERYSEADGAVFGLAVAFNERSILDKEARAAIEREADVPLELFRSRVTVIARRWPFLREVLARWQLDDSDDPGQPPVQDHGDNAAMAAYVAASQQQTAVLSARVETLAGQLRNLGYIIFVAAVLVIVFLRR